MGKKGCGCGGACMKCGGHIKKMQTGGETGGTLGDVIQRQRANQVAGRMPAMPANFDTYLKSFDDYLASAEDVRRKQNKLDTETKEVMDLRKRLGETAAKHGDRGAMFYEMGIPERLIKDIESRDGYTCNTYSGACMREAGLTIPEAAPEMKIGSITYGPGDKMPYIPGNAQFNSYAQKLGWELQPKGTKPTEAGDLVRGHMYLDGVGTNGAQHSVFSAGDRDGDGLPDLYNNSGIPRDPYRRREGYIDPMATGIARDGSDYYTTDSGVMKYVRNIPQYTDELKLSKQERDRLKKESAKRDMPKAPSIPAQQLKNGGMLNKYQFGGMQNPFAPQQPMENTGIMPDMSNTMAEVQRLQNLDVGPAMYAPRSEYMYARGGNLPSYAMGNPTTPPPAETMMDFKTPTTTLYSGERGQGKLTPGMSGAYGARNTSFATEPTLGFGRGMQVEKVPGTEYGQRMAERLFNAPTGYGDVMKSMGRTEGAILSRPSSMVFANGGSLPKASWGGKAIGAVGDFITKNPEAVGQIASALPAVAGIFKGKQQMNQQMHTPQLGQQQMGMMTATQNPYGMGYGYMPQYAQQFGAPMNTPYANPMSNRPYGSTSMYNGNTFGSAADSYGFSPV